MSKEPEYITQEYFQGWIDRLYESVMDDVKKLDDRIVVLEALTRGMRLPDELDIAGQTYVKKLSS